MTSHYLNQRSEFQTQVPSLREDDAQLICSESEKETKLNEALECFTVNKGRFVTVQNHSPEVQVISPQSKQKTILKEAPDWFVLNKDNKARPVSVENDSPEVQILGERNFSEKCNELCDTTDQIYNKNLIAESNVKSCENFGFVMQIMIEREERETVGEAHCLCPVDLLKDCICAFVLILHCLLCFPVQIRFVARAFFV